MTLGLVARTEMLGGILLIVAGMLLFFAYLFGRNRKVGRELTGYIFATMFLVVGLLISVKGYRTELALRKRFDDMHSNLELLKDALDQYQKSMQIPAKKD